MAKVAVSLKEVVQDEGHVFRQGGDEFIITLPDMQHEDVEEIAKQILHYFTVRLSLANRNFLSLRALGSVCILKMGRIKKV